MRTDPSQASRIAPGARDLLPATDDLGVAYGDADGQLKDNANSRIIVACLGQ
ncbi:hypothetical protein [Streptomyces niveus]|uniref:hypothetical protein n=1 Tax=Streptomyces niveus TaxID=193462 RepID=UPI003868AD77